MLYNSRVKEKTITVPTKLFVYPGDRHMCLDGLVRAAFTGTQILRGEIDPEEIKIMALKGQRAICSGADTHKRNLIYYIVYSHAHRGDLNCYVNTNGDFILNNLQIGNVFSVRNRNTLDKLLSTGIIHD